MAEQRPSVGRIVHYTPDIGNHPKGQAYPAVITHVFSDTCVNLYVLSDGSFPLLGRGSIASMVSGGQLDLAKSAASHMPTSVCMRTSGQVAGPCWDWPLRT